MVVVVVVVVAIVGAVVTTTSYITCKDKINSIVLTSHGAGNNKDNGKRDNK